MAAKKPMATAKAGKRAPKRESEEEREVRETAALAKYENAIARYHRLSDAAENLRRRAREERDRGWRDERVTRTERDAAALEGRARDLRRAIVGETKGPGRAYATIVSEEGRRPLAEVAAAFQAAYAGDLGEGDWQWDTVPKHLRSFVVVAVAAARGTNVHHLVREGHDLSHPAFGDAECVARRAYDGWRRGYEQRSKAHPAESPRETSILAAERALVGADGPGGSTTIRGAKGTGDVPARDMAAVLVEISLRRTMTADELAQWGAAARLEARASGLRAAASSLDSIPAALRRPPGRNPDEAIDLRSEADTSEAGARRVRARVLAAVEARERTDQENRSVPVDSPSERGAEFLA